MLARLILALLLAAFAFPAMANGPCHDAPAMMPMAHHGDAPRHMPASDERGMAPHVCIGCIPPATIAPRPVATPFAYAPMRRAIVASAVAPGLRAPPILPPPRPTA
ncbi:hypothetical protein [Sphingomonas sp. TREG-RG-20F-R18-01]|uniref:hypothetical protein n=1 Tax=Sphingomonas sp. TREG-RG-20F-R18-01 TaxID=2914982 RepID=UPI001F59A72E